MCRCQAIVGGKTRYKVTQHQQCQNEASYHVDGVLLCGTHFNAGFRRELLVVTSLRLLNDGDL